MSHEQLTNIEKSSAMRRLSFEESMTHINGPVYGLDSMLFGLLRRTHIWQGDAYMRVEYFSSHYMQYAFRNDQTFTVTTRTFADEQTVVFGCSGLVLEAGAVILVECPWKDRPAFVTLFENRDKSVRMVVKDVILAIDGKCFKGSITHYTAPLRYSSFELSHDRVALQGEALGPSIEEVAEIIKNLRVLNAEQIVERNKMQ